MQAQPAQRPDPGAAGPASGGPRRYGGVCVRRMHGRSPSRTAMDGEPARHIACRAGPRDDPAAGRPVSVPPMGDARDPARTAQPACTKTCGRACSATQSSRSASSASTAAAPSSYLPSRSPRRGPSRHRPLWSTCPRPRRGQTRAAIRTAAAARWPASPAARRAPRPPESGPRQSEPAGRARRQYAPRVRTTALSVLTMIIKSSASDQFST